MLDRSLPARPDPQLLPPATVAAAEASASGSRWTITIEFLPAEPLALMLSFLRARELAHANLSCKLFDQELVRRACRLVVDDIHPTLLSEFLATASTQGSHTGALRWLELKRIFTLIAAPEAPKGFWVSKTWCNHARKWVELQRPLLCPKKAKGKAVKRRSRSNGSRRSSSSDLPPWPDINADIVCEHGNLARACSMRGKRRVVDCKTWAELIKFYPTSRAFPTAESGECIICACQVAAREEDKQRLCLQVKQSRKAELCHPARARLFGRRTGVPQHLHRGRDRSPMQLPLLPGVYHLLPRFWLRTWRHFIRDHQAPPPPPLESSHLLCEAHGLPLVPPHVSQFLAGDRDALLPPLDDAESEHQQVLCEILADEEYDALLELYPAEDHPRFAVLPDHRQVHWRTEPCLCCDSGHADVCLRWRSHTRGPLHQRHNAPPRASPAKTSPGHGRARPGPPKRR